MKRSGVLALDLGSATFKLLLLEKEGGQAKVTQARLSELPPQADAATREAALRSLLEGIRPEKLSQVVSVVDDSFACVRLVRTPRIPMGEVAEAVKWELQRFLALPPEETSVDFELLGEEEEQGARKLKLLAAALPSGAVRDHLALLDRVGLKPTQLLPKVVALGMWAGRAGPAQKEPVALLEMGASGSEFVVAQGGHPVFARKIPMGGVEITRGMTGVLMTAQGQMGLTEPEAETVKRSIGIPEGDSAELVGKGISRAQLLSLIRGSLDRLATELERSLTFYGESSGGGGVTQLLIVGGGAHLKGLAVWLEGRLGIRVQAADAWEGRSVSTNALQGAAASTPLSFIPALGAALAGGAGINLLPQEWKEAARLRMQRMALTGLASLAAAGLVLLWAGMHTYRHSLRNQVGALQIERGAVVSQLPLIRAAVAVQEGLAEEPDWEVFFRGLSLLTPKEIYLTELSVQGRTVALRGRVRRVAGSSEPVLTGYIRVLKERLFSDVQLRSSRRTEGSLDSEEFELGGELR